MHQGTSIDGVGGKGRQRFIQQHGPPLMVMMMFVTTMATAVLGRLFPSPLHQRLVTFHAEDALRCSCIFEILNLLLAVPAPETGCAESLIAGDDGEILDLVPAGAAAICTIVADKGAVAEEEEVGVRVQEGTTRVAAETVNMPTIARWKVISISISEGNHEETRTKFEGFSFVEDLHHTESRQQLGLMHANGVAWDSESGGGITSPHPLHGNAASSCSTVDSGNPAGESIMIIILPDRPRSTSLGATRVATAI